MFEKIDSKLIQHGETHEKILEQVTYTNGKVRKLYLYLTVVASVTATLFATNTQELIGFIKLIL